MIYVTGDLHGEEERLYSRSMKKLREGDTLIVCGDFGFVWDGSGREKKILDFLGSRNTTSVLSTAPTRISTCLTNTA